MVGHELTFLLSRGVFVGNYSFMIRIIGWVLLAAALILLQFGINWAGMAASSPGTPEQKTWLAHAVLGAFGSAVILLAAASALVPSRPGRLRRFVGTLALSSIFCLFVAVLTNGVFSSFYRRVARSLLRYFA